MDIEVEIEEKEGKAKYDEYDCERFAKTLMEAEEIKADSEKMAAAQKHISKLKKDISSLDDLKAIAKEKREAEANG